MNNNPEDLEGILSAFRNFRQSMLKFGQIARQIRQFNETNTEVEIMGKEIEEMMEQIECL